jgi:hypothetical protein
MHQMDEHEGSLLRGDDTLPEKTHIPQCIGVFMV